MNVSGNISGHVRKRENKSGVLTYQVIIELPTDSKTGKRKRIYRTVRGNKKQAERTMRNIINDLENQTYVKPTSTSLKDWITEYYDIYLKTTLSESTLRGYKYQIDKYIIPLLGDMPIQSISAKDVQQWVNKIKANSPISNKPISAKTVKNIYLNLSAALDKAVQLEILKKNPCKNTVLPKCKPHEVDVYDENEILKLISCAEGSDMELPIMLELTLGLRRGELIALRWENVDLNNGMVHICENRVEGLDGKVINKLPKSNAGIRDIPLSPSLINLLKKYHTKYLEKQLKYGIGRNKDDYVICQKNGQPYRPYSFTKKFRTFLADNNLRHIRLHDLRHTNASIMLSQGISPKVAQQRLGHSDFSTTMNVYSHVLKSVENEAAQKLDDVIFQNVCNK